MDRSHKSKNEYSSSPIPDAEGVGRPLLKSSPVDQKGAASPEPVTIEEFKRQLGRDLHDDCGQVMTLLQLRLAMMQAALPPERSDLVAQTEGVVELVAQLSRRLHLLCAELRSPPSPTEGLAAVLRKLIAEIAVLMPDLRILLHAPEEVQRWPVAHQEAFYHICQEALTNIMRHAQARRVVIELAEEQGGLVLTVRDDGRGIVPASTATASQGLTGMRERLEFLGGSLQIETKPGQGTLIRARAPLSRQSSDD